MEDDPEVIRPMSPQESLYDRILSLTRQYAGIAHARPEFRPGEDPIPYAGRVFDAEEICAVVESALEFWLTEGRFTDQFESSFARYMGVRHCMLVNSGSSANLLAISALTSGLWGDKSLKPGDEVITAAAGFPTTINPIVQNRLVPVLVDVELGLYNPTIEAIAEAVGPRTRAVFLAHTLGNPFDVAAVRRLCDERDLWLIQDCCDAAGGTFDGKPVASYGDLATTSFFPAHQMTMGEGGAVLALRPLAKRAVESFRDWGRDCWCAPGDVNTCGKRFEWQLGELPYGYDHKYIYSHIGYNMKITEMQAAIGVAQLQKLPKFVEDRRAHFVAFSEAFADYDDRLLLPRSLPHAEPSWFGFPIYVRETAGFTRDELVAWLESNKVGTRMLFGGNILRQPAYADFKSRVPAPLANSDRLMRQVFFIGVYPGISEAQRNHVVGLFHDFLVTGKRAANVDGTATSRP